MGEWPSSRADPDQFSDPSTDEIPVVRDQLWTPARAPALAYRERAPAPRSRRAEMLAAVRRYAQLPVLVAAYLGVVVAASLLVARLVHAPVKSPSAVSTRHEQQHNDLRPHRSAQHHRSGAHKRPVIRPAGTPAPSPAGPSPASSQPLPSPPASSSSRPSPSPSPTRPSPTPSSPSPTPTLPSPTPTLPSPTPTLPSPTLTLPSLP